jgi:hypothetical protein
LDPLVAEAGERGLKGFFSQRSYPGAAVATKAKA